MEKQSFERRYRKIRDDARTPYESWLARTDAEHERDFNRSLEELGPTDFEEVLLEAAAKSVRYVRVKFRHNSSDDIVIDMLEKYVEAILLPLEESKLLGIAFWSFGEGQEGWFFIELFNPDDGFPAAVLATHFDVHHKDLVEALKKGGAERVYFAPKSRQ